MLSASPPIPAYNASGSARTYAASELANINLGSFPYLKVLTLGACPSRRVEFEELLINLPGRLAKWKSLDSWQKFYRETARCCQR